MNIKYEQNDSEFFSNELGLNLHKYNQQNCEYIRQNSNKHHNDKEIINIAVYDEYKLIGGASGWIQFGWYYLNQLYIDQDYRKMDIGTELITLLEKKARMKNCVGLKTETWSFQARGFYEKQGFSVYAELKDFPPGAVKYYLKKIL